MALQVSLEQAYAEACQKIGEGIVRESVLIQELNGLTVENAILKEKLVAAGLIEEAEDIVKEAPDANQRDGSRHGANGSVPHPPSEG